MPLSQQDRITFSLAIISADDDIAGITNAQNSINKKQQEFQKLDDANKNLFDPVNALVNGYQAELQRLDGNGRTSILEQDIIDSSNHTLGNHFFPNNALITVPSLVPYGNVWSKVSPFALTFGLGKSYTETYTPVTKEPDLISAAVAFITSAGSHSDIENTSGQHCLGGTCSIPIYEDQATCEAHSGVWTPGDNIQTFAAVQTLKSDLVSAINTLKTFLLAEVAVIVTTDTDVTRSTQNQAAIDNINLTIIPALNTWLGYVDFNTAHGQTTCAGFNGYNSNLLAPTKLHSTQLAALNTALSARSTFITTRTTQLNTNLGGIVQNLDTGFITSSSGFYGQRYSYLALRLNALNGSLQQASNLTAASGAQDSIKANIANTKAIYQTLLSVSLLKAPASGTSLIHVVDSSFFSPGDTVYLYADNQEELLRAVKSVSNDIIILNDVVPSKYRPQQHARLYKVLV